MNPAAAEKSEMPGFIKPQLATLKARAPSGDQWLHEVKFDGYRVQVHLNRGRKKVYTRNGLDWTKRFSIIAGALDIPGQAITDWEVVVIKDGRTNFSELQAELARGDQDNLIFYAFDLLWRDGISANFLRLSASNVFQISSATGSRCLNTSPSCTSKGSSQNERMHPIDLSEPKAGVQFQDDCKRLVSTWAFASRRSRQRRKGNYF